jgi:hypothetical protein
MWARCLVGCCVIWLAAADLRADQLGSARLARALLGPDAWTQVLRIEKVRPGFPRHSVVYALAFELEDRLWYYAEDFGTQSLSLYGGHLLQDKANLGPLLQQIDRGFRHYEVLEEGKSEKMPGKNRADLPQGCFIECLARLRAMVAAGEVPDEAQLMAYYAAATVDTPGHTVLYFTRAGRRYCYDPMTPSKPKPVPAYVSSDALAIARWSAPGQNRLQPQRAVFLPLHLPKGDNSELSGRALVADGSERSVASPRRS